MAQVDNLGSGKISRLVNRLRSPSKPGSHPSSSNRIPFDVASSRNSSGSSTDTEAFQSLSRTSTHPQVTQRERGGSLMKVASFRTFLSSSSHNDHGFSSSTSTRQQSPISMSRSISAARQGRAADAELSLNLWTESYNHLRDSPSSAGLVTAFESIVCQELPDHLKNGMNMTFRDHPESKRLDLMATITAAGTAKRSINKHGQAEDDIRRLLDVGKVKVADAVETYPSAAVAWCGLCTLTPLLLNPVTQRHQDLRKGLQHTIGRLHWYMLLSVLLDRGVWHSAAAYAAQVSTLRDTIVRVYRKVIEFQMTIVCATASAWNRAAKNVVDWNGLSQMVESLEQMDAELEMLANRELVEGWSQRLRSEEGDVVIRDESGWIGTI